MATMSEDLRNMLASLGTNPAASMPGRQRHLWLVDDAGDRLSNQPGYFDLKRTPVELTFHCHRRGIVAHVVDDDDEVIYSVGDLPIYTVDIGSTFRLRLDIS